ncbi:hypothetical protein FH972_023376 [Carpinus fangiana]|uniref:EKC/KEOPS complex subunit GON7 n=1 Tax=Carpinus fangiana TaxID=176857 RepID=A0A5N6KV95_9ROSI|nr:hypothetical protein FH972_023376 [Carpinus fangiana]
MSVPSDNLTASYKAPNGTQEFTHAVTTPPSTPSTEDTAVYLGLLRKYTAQMQSEMNTFLTQKMDEDRKTAESTGSNSTPKIDEAKEEENYGEEVDEA